MYSSSWLEQIENLDKSGKYKQADAIVKKMIKEAVEYASQVPGESYPQVQSSPQMTQFYTAYRPLFVYLKNKHGIDLFALPKKLEILFKAEALGIQPPEDILKQLSSFKEAFKDIKATPALETFLKNYPDIYKDFSEINAQTRFLKGKNYLDWLGGVKNLDEYKKAIQDLNQTKNIAKDIYQAGHGILDVKNIPLVDLQKIKSGVDAQKQMATFNTTAANYLKAMGHTGSNLESLTTSELVSELKKLNGSVAKGMETRGNGLLNTLGTTIDDADNILIAAKDPQKVQEMKTLLEGGGHSTQGKTATEIIKDFKSIFANSPLLQDAGIAKGATQAATATAEGAEAAGAIAKKFPVLNKILGPLGIILSLPAAFKWTQKILAGDEFTNEEIAECVQDLLNLFAGIAFMIPGGQAVSAVLGGLSLAIMGGSWIAGQFGTAQETKEKQEKDILNLMEQATPGNFSAFNDFLHDKNLDYNKMKIIDVFNNLEEWIKTGKGTKTFDWFINPTEQNQAKRELFNQKYLNLFNTFRKGGDVTNQESGLAFNSLEDVKKTYDSQYSQNPFIGDAFKQNKPLKEIISTIQRDMAPGMPKGQKWFANVPLNLPDSELLKWYNKSFPNKSLTAQINNALRMASPFNLKKYQQARD
jgi:hypothetical protein